MPFGTRGHLQVASMFSAQRHQGVYSLFEQVVMF